MARWILYTDGRIIRKPNLVIGTRLAQESQLDIVKEVQDYDGALEELRALRNYMRLKPKVSKTDTNSKPVRELFEHGAYDQKPKKKDA